MIRLPASLAVGVLSLAVAAWAPRLASEEAKPEAKPAEHAAPATDSHAAPAADKKEAAPAADQKPSATLEFASEQMRLIMGGTAGKGTLHFNGTDYPFTFKTASASLGAKVVTKVSGSGEVYNLKKVEDFSGEYLSTSKSAMAGSAEVQASYKNDKDVVVNVRGTAQGAGLSFGGGMATITLVRQ
jgi:hypothetical protein